jgi:hypothetical protein
MGSTGSSSGTIGFSPSRSRHYSDMRSRVISFFEGRACVLPQILLDRDYFLNRLSATAGREMQAASIKGRVRKIQGKR